MRISLVVNTRNEEENLPGLLESARGVDEIVVADMESTDATLEIARRHGARILPLPNAGFCEPGRQPAIDHATGDWVLVLDADERLPPGGVEKIRSLVSGVEPQVGGFSFIFHVYLGETRIHESGWDTNNERHARLFRKGHVVWPSLVHYSPTVTGEVILLPESELFIVHRNFRDLQQAVAKFNRYSSVEARELVEAGRVPELLVGLREAFDELARRYSPDADGGLSLALSFGIFLYRLLVQAKAAEILGWPPDSLPGRESLLRGIEEFRQALGAATLTTAPRGRPEQEAPGEAGPQAAANRATSLSEPPPEPAPTGLLQDFIARLLRALQDRQEAITGLNGERDQLRALSESVGQELAVARRTIEQLKSELLAEQDRSQRELAVAAANLAGRSDELEATRTELIGKETSLARAAESIRRLNAEVVSLESKLEEATRWTWANLPSKTVRALKRRGRIRLSKSAPARLLSKVREKRVIERIAASGLFDAEYYLKTYPDVAESDMNPLRHYVLHGADEGRNPHPMFDTGYYREHNREALSRGMNPLLHFVLKGLADGRRPSPAYSAEAYASASRRRGLSMPPGPPGKPVPVPLASREAPKVPAAPVQFSAVRLGSGTPERPSSTATHLTIAVSHVLPHPPRAGNEYRIQRLLRWLSSQGHIVHLVVSPLPGEEPDDAAIARAAQEYPSLVLVHRDGKIDYRTHDPLLAALLEGKSGKRSTSLSVQGSEHDARIVEIEQTFCPDHLIELLVEMEHALSPDMVLCNYAFMSRFLPRLQGRPLKVIDTHDVFSTKAAKVIRYGLRDDLGISAGEEGVLLQRADLIIAIQSEEETELRSLAQDRLVVTAGVDFDVPPLTSPPSDPIVLFVGSNNSLNVKGIREYLEIAWPLIREAVPGARTWIAGPVCEALEAGIPGVELLGRVERLDDVYRRSRLVINPAVAGTGLKIKTLEALAHARPPVVWPSGVEGLSPQLARLCEVADSWFDFSERVARRLERPPDASATPDQIRKLLSAEFVYADLHAALAERLTSTGLRAVQA